MKHLAARTLWLGHLGASCRFLSPARQWGSQVRSWSEMLRLSSFASRRDSAKPYRRGFLLLSSSLSLCLSLSLSASLFFSSLSLSLILSQCISISICFSVSVSLWSLSLFLGVSSSLFLPVCWSVSICASLPRSLTHANTSPQAPFTYLFSLLHLHGQNAILTVGWAPAQRGIF